MAALRRRLGSLASGRLAPSWFVAQTLDLACWNLFDLGVVDRRRCGTLDIFTVNHNSRQSLLENDGAASFRDVLTEQGLDQDRRFPGWADDVEAPSAIRPGLYLYRQGNALIVRSVVGGGHDPIGGSLRLLSPLRDLAPSDIDADVEAPVDHDLGAVVRFLARRSGHLELRPDLVGLPVSVHLDSSTALDHVFVGPAMARPPGHEFVLKLQDRHGMAWADLEHGGPLDVFVARGGLRGRLEHYRSVVSDELFVHDGNGYEDIAARLFLDKGMCRSRQAAWVPLAEPSGLHLFVSCHGAAPQLHRRSQTGQFVDVATDVGLGDARGDRFSWVDVDGDGHLELLAVEGGQLTVYRSGGSGRFKVHQVLVLRGDRVGNLAIGDHDGDGDCDLFAPSPSGNTLLVNDDGQYRAVDPRTVGLPERGGVAASWVDFDNDGLLDLHVVPGGLYRQQEGGVFEPTFLLDRRIPSRVADARVTWFDANGDGARDVVVATVSSSKAEDGGFDWAVQLVANVGSRGHWLQVDLHGPPGNPHALGAVVTVVSAGRTTSQWVGCSEGSHFSQGHYRLYFGLGDVPEAESVSVRWPDGSVGGLGRTAGDERVTITYPGLGSPTDGPYA